MSDPIRKLRLAWNTPGEAHFLTFSCYGRLPLLTRPRPLSGAKPIPDVTAGVKFVSGQKAERTAA